MKKTIRMIFVVLGMFSINLSHALASDDIVDCQDSGVIENCQEEIFSIGVSIEVGKDVGEYTGAVKSRLISQQGITLKHRSSGAYVGALSYVTDRVEEIDLIVGIEKELLGISFDAGVSFYGVNEDEDWVAPYVGAYFPEIFGVVPFVYLEADYGLDGGRGGLLWNFGVDKNVNILDAEYLFKIEFGGNDGFYGTEPKTISFGRLSISTDTYWLGLIITPSISIQKGSDRDGVAGDETLMYGALTIIF